MKFKIKHLLFFFRMVFPTQTELVRKYNELISKLDSLKEKGLAAAVYTQTTDVESEINGLMTYDRKVLKFDKVHMKKTRNQLIKDDDK